MCGNSVCGDGLLGSKLHLWFAVEEEEEKHTSVAIDVTTPPDLPEGRY